MNQASPRSARSIDSAQQAGWMLALAAVLAIVGLGMALVEAKLLALGLVALAAGLTLLVMPDIATLLVALVIYTNAAVIAVRFHGVPHVVGAATILLLVVPLYHQLLARRREIIVLPAVPLIVLFVGVRLISTTIARRQDIAIGATTATLTEGLILYLLVTNVIRDIVVLRRVVWTLAIAGAFLGALTAAQQWTGDFTSTFGGFAQAEIELMPIDAEEATNPRSAGPIGEKNYYAQFMLLLLPLVIPWIWSQRHIALRCAAGLAAILVTIGVAFTASRGAAVGFVVMLAAMLGLGQIRWRSAIVIAGVATVILLAMPTFRERIAESSGLIDMAQGNANVRAVDKSTQGRITEMLAAALVFWENPVLGVGPGNFPAHFLEKADALGFQVHAEERLAHCSYLELAAESGLFGLLAYLGILAVTFRGLWRARRISASPEAKHFADAFLVMMIVLSVTAVFLSFAYERYYWFLLALAGAAAHIGCSTPIAAAVEAPANSGPPNACGRLEASA